MIGGSISGINFAGLATGIDTESIIQRLVELQSRPLQQLMVRKSQLNARMSAFDQFQGLVRNLQTAAGALATRSAFNILKGTSSDTNVVTVNPSAEALPGTYEIRVSRLAQAHKIVSGAHSSDTAELGVSGRFLLNGKVIEVSANDTLRSIASKINNANAGVTASILRADGDQYYLTLTANETGSNSQIQLAEIGGNLILTPTLKLVTYEEFVRNQQANAALSSRFRSATESIGSQLGITGAPSGTIRINGVDIALDFGTDSLERIANKINSADAGVTATVETETENGTTYYRLKIDGGSRLPEFEDPDNLLKQLGVLQNRYQNELVQAQDAEFTIDGFTFRRSKNQVSDAIPGVTFTLLSADASNPKTATITLTRDTEAVKKNVQGFIDAYNALVDFIKQNASFDKETLETGVLFGDTTVSLVRDSILQRIMNPVDGLDSNLRVLAQVGVMLGEDGKLTLNEGTLLQKLGEDLNGVIRLFTAQGTATDPNITFVSATDATRPSPTGGYEVVITQVATKAKAVAGTAQTAARATSETLTFSGSLFGDETYSITLDPGTTIDDTIARINNDPRLKNLVVASKDASGRLVIEARNYGSASSFRVVSNLAAGPDNSGIGTDGIDANGQDVAGTINGEPATGRGQFLTGDTGNPNTDGLQIRVTATTPGTYGVVHFTRGVADLVRLYARQATDITNGDLKYARDTLQDQIKAIDDQMQRIRDEVSRRQIMLREQFARLERSISQMQSQGARLAAMMGGMGAMSLFAR